MTIDTDKLEKIRALLTKAESTHFPEEAKACSAKAAELMAKWSIDEAMVNGLKNVGSIDQSVIVVDGNEYRGPKISLLAVVAEFNRCKIIQMWQQYVEVDGKRKRVVPAHVIGFKDDREFVETLYISLLFQSGVELLSPDVQNTLRAMARHATHSISFRNSFMRGYTSSVAQRLREARDRAMAQAAKQYGAQTTALVVADRGKAVARRFNEMFPRIRKVSSSAGSSMAGYGHGVEAGKRADLGQKKVGG